MPAVKVRLFLILIIFPLLLAGALLARYLYTFDGLLNDRSAWGQLGDYFGGLINPVLSYLAFLAVSISLYFSQEANRFTAKSSQLAQEVMLDERRFRKEEATQKLIDEFFSTAFLQHRIAVSELSKKINKGVPDLGTVACGFWYPGGEKPYAGVLYGDFNEHQHLEAYLGFLIRLSGAVDRNLVDVGVIGDSIRTSLLWHAGLVTKLSRLVTEQVEEKGKPAQLPVWVHSVESLNTAFGYDFEVMKALDV